MCFNESVSLWEKDEGIERYRAVYRALPKSLTVGTFNIYCVRNITPCFCPVLRGELHKGREGKGLSSGVRFVRKFIFRGSQKSTDYPICPVISSLAIKLSKIVAYSFWNPVHTLDDMIDNVIIVKKSGIELLLWSNQRRERRLIFRNVEECSVNGRRIVNVIEFI